MAPARIVTFYSYKGGVGRTSALANAAWILASSGYRVCAVDWDLEAPGLHRYFYPFMLDRELTSTDGLIDFLSGYMSQAMTRSEDRPDDWYESYADLSTYAVPIDWEHFPSGGSLDLVVAGRQGPAYAAKVNSFEWQTFYQRFAGGAFLNEVKRQLRDEYDFVLIDSRTGVSDTAGICTAQLPDQLVACFMHNAQSIEGTAAVAESAVRLRTEAPLEVFPVPMRVELGEKDRLDRAREFAWNRFRGFLSHLTPSQRSTYWSDVEVLYQPYYAYEEILATFGDRDGSKFAVSSAVERLCDRLTKGGIGRISRVPEVERQRVLDVYGQRFAPVPREPQPNLDVPLVEGEPPETAPVEIPATQTLRTVAPLRILLSTWAMATVVLLVVVVVVVDSPEWALLLVRVLLAVALLGTVVLTIVTRPGDWLRQRFSRFDRRYRAYVLSSLRFVDLKGLTTVGFYTPVLDEVFVDTSVAYRAPHQVSAGLLGSPAEEQLERHSVMEFIAGRNPVVLAVIGPPGSGKTTLLRHAARAVCVSRRRERQRTVPILLYLRDHSTAISVDPGVGLATLLRGTLGRDRTSEPEGWFERQLARGQCVVLLDGLDEVYAHNERRVVVEWIERQVKRYPLNHFVVTARPHGYMSAPINGAMVVQVRGFSDTQLHKFVHSWYFAVVKHTTRRSGEEVAATAAIEANNFLTRLHDTPELQALTTNPLLLTMIVNVHLYRGALPGSRAELYSEICQVMLWRRQEAKKLQVPLRGSVKEAILGDVAYGMMCRRTHNISEGALVLEIDPLLRKASRQMDTDAFIADIMSTGLMVEDESGQFAFVHLTFQEFLAASHARERGLVKELADAVDDVWWRETILLYTARSDADQIIMACLESGSRNALSLARDCVDQAVEFSPDLRDRLMDALARLGPA